MSQAEQTSPHVTHQIAEGLSWDARIVVTGAAGFISSVLLSDLNRLGFTRLILVDDFSREDKRRNYASRRYEELVPRTEFGAWLNRNGRELDIIFHLGARTDTTEQDNSIFDALNREPSRLVWQLCSDYGIPLVYASSAATYGGGEQGYTDSHEHIAALRPLNPYGDSKQDFDLWALQQAEKGVSPPKWAGLKFFNVYGPNEYHKGRMASVVFHAFKQISKDGSMKLFRSHREGIEDGHQSRDFISVLDVSACLTGLLSRLAGGGEFESGLYNLGTGQARTFLDLTRAVFRAMDLEPDIRFVDTPADIRETYQYFTQADMSKWNAQAIHSHFMSLEEGVELYVRQYLSRNLVY